METDQAEQLDALLSQSARALTKIRKLKRLMLQLPQNEKIGPALLLITKIQQNGIVMAEKRTLI